MPTYIEHNIVFIVPNYPNRQQEAADHKAGSVRAELASRAKELGPALEEVIEAQEDYWSSEAASWGNASRA